MDEFLTVFEWAKGAGVPASAVVAVGVAGYAARVLYKLAQNLSTNPGLGEHLVNIEAALKGILAQQQDGVQVHGEMAESLSDIARDIAIIKDRGR